MKILVIIISTVLIQFAYGLTQAEREAVVQAHNNYRSQLAKGQTILQNSYNAQPAKNLYKLMTWANTTQIGCGVQQCSSYTLVVCNYYQQGNSMCAPVYEVGQACTADNQCTSFPNSTCEVSSGLCQAEATWYYSNETSNAMTSTSCRITPPRNCITAGEI
uniref:SCP domain-containing protein n=1 Tax=Acrobeloides nanus TaxID=290746 RepID=A0A914DUT0_9BILA